MVVHFILANFRAKEIGCMKKKWLTVLGIIVLLMSVPIYMLATELKIEGESLDGEEKPTVLHNKIWKFTFSDQLDQESINNETVYVTDDEGEKIETHVSLGNDLKSLSIEPPENGYDLSPQFYTLHIEKEIKSLQGRGLNSKEELQFTVKESLPVVGSKEKLHDYFNKILKEQEKERKGLFGVAIHESSEESASNSSADSSAKSSENVSETNIQVQGVDESDIVKTNGTHIFQVADGKVNVIAVNDGVNMDLQTVIKYSETFFPYQIFLHEDKLLVIGSSYEELDHAIDAKQSTENVIAPMQDTTKAIVYNIKDPKNPIEEKVVWLEGHLVSSRKIDSKVYMVTNQYPQYWILRDNKNVDLRPKFSDSAVSKESLVVDYDEIQYFPDSKESNYTIIAAFDLNNPSEEANITSYLGSGHQLYMSKENLYLAVENWEAIPMVDGRFDTPNTNIYKFSIDDLNVEFHSSTEVEGRILNQFSMDEHEGYFRVATTKGMVWDEARPSSNQLFIFDENLKHYSSLEDLARGERIYSARFMGDRVYIVTFKETDPLFVIDTSDPKNPKVMGELKIPGFSNYLHPVDENHLIGFGHDTKIVPTKGEKAPRILTNGVKISLFDVTDMKNPTEKFTDIIGGRGTYSPLDYDHKALLYHKGKNLFAFPINVYQNVKGSEYEQTFEFQGAYVYQVDPDKGFSLESKITHMDKRAPYEEWENEIQRLIYIGDTLYALSPSKISSHSLKDFQFKAELSLKK